MVRVVHSPTSDQATAHYRGVHDMITKGPAQFVSKPGTPVGVMSRSSRPCETILETSCQLVQEGGAPPWTLARSSTCDG